MTRTRLVVPGRVEGLLVVVVRPSVAELLAELLVLGHIFPTG